MQYCSKKNEVTGGVMFTLQYIRNKIDSLREVLYNVNISIVADFVDLVRI